MDLEIEVVINKPIGIEGKGGGSCSWGENWPMKGCQTITFKRHVMNHL